MPFIGLLFTIGLFVALTKLLQRYTKLGINNNNSEQIKLEAVRYIDNNNKIVKIRYNNTSHLILIGKNNHLLIDKYDEESK